MYVDKNYIGGSSYLLVLSLISRKDMYGYEIIKELEVLSEEAFQFKEGTLYPILHKFENSGWIESYTKLSDSGKERKYYHITKLGLQQCAEEQKQWDLFKDSVMKVLDGNRYVSD